MCCLLLVCSLSVICYVLFCRLGSWLSVVYYPVFVACCVLVVRCFLLFVVCGLSFVVCRVSLVVRWLLLVVSCSLVVVCGSLFCCRCSLCVVVVLCELFVVVFCF